MSRRSTNDHGVKVLARHLFMVTGIVSALHFVATLMIQASPAHLARTAVSPAGVLLVLVGASAAVFGMWIANRWR